MAGFAVDVSGLVSLVPAAAARHLCSDPVDEFDQFNEDHDGDAEPEIQSAAEVRDKDGDGHRRTIVDDERVTTIDDDVQLDEVPLDQVVEVSDSFK